MPARVTDRIEGHTRHMVPGQLCPGTERLLVRPVLPGEGCGGVTFDQQGAMTHSHILMSAYAFALPLSSTLHSTASTPIYHFTHSDTAPLPSQANPMIG